MAFSKIDFPEKRKRIQCHFSLLKNKFQKPKKLKESPLNPPLSPFFKGGS
jgi:hypothetical protein